MFVIAALAIAVVDWWSVRFGRERVEAMAKPLTLGVLAVGVGVNADGVADWLVVLALSLSFLGDLLLLPVVDRFLEGLASFLLAHLAYIAAFGSSLDLDSSAGRLALLVGAGVALGLGATVGRRIIVASSTQGPTLSVAVKIYIAALSVMTLAGFGTGAVVAACGALLFAFSDAILGWNRFVAPLPQGRLLTHVPYHLGQGLIALWAIHLN